MDGLQDAVAKFDESNPINIKDNDIFFEFPSDDDVNLYGLEVQGEHHLLIQIIQGEQLNPTVDIGSTAAQELPKFHVWTKDHPPNHVIGNINDGVKTRSTSSIQNKCHFSAFISMIKHKSIKKTLEHADWITAMKMNLLNLTETKYGLLFLLPQTTLLSTQDGYFATSLMMLEA